MCLFDKRATYLLLLLLLPLGVGAQSHGFQVALRGGGNTWLGGGIRSDVAPMVGIDFGYAFHASLGEHVALGFRTGVSPVFSKTQLHASSQDLFSQTDYQQRHIAYRCTAGVDESVQMLSAEVPLLLTMRLHGLTLGVGPQARIVLFSPYKQTLSSPQITATYTDLGVTMTNQLITGCISPSQLSSEGADALSRFQVLLAAEIGYDWRLTSRNMFFSEKHIGLQLFATYGLWQAPLSASPYLIYVPAISDPLSPVAHPEVGVYTRVLAASSSLRANGSRPHDLTIGLRLYFTIESIDYAHYGWHRRR